MGKELEFPSISPEYYITSEIFKEITDISHSSWERATYPLPREKHGASIKAEYNISPQIYNYNDIISHSTYKWTRAHVQANHLVPI